MHPLLSLQQQPFLSQGLYPQTAPRLAAIIGPCISIFPALLDAFANGIANDAVALCRDISTLLEPVVRADHLRFVAGMERIYTVHVAIL